jgi:hypothetical protein
MENFSIPPLITGLFSIQRNGQSVVTAKMIREIKQSLKVNTWYRKNLIFLAGDLASARILETFDLPIYRVFDDAPGYIREKPAFRMKHWMVFWILQRFGEALWIDWDTISLMVPDDYFFFFCRAFQTPKFVFIPGYHATVNCSVYYVSHHWMEAMEKSFYAKVSSPNDELMWQAVLPKEVVNLKQFWWEDMVTNVWLESECAWIKKNTYFAHVKTFSYFKRLQEEKLKLK